MAQSYLRNPSIERLPTILEELHTGLLQIPPFQRDFVWTGKQRLELFSSVEKGLPAGSLMVWRTNRKLPKEPLIGPYRAAEAAGATAVQYLLDGRQRITTLYAALAPAFWTRDDKLPSEDENPPQDGSWAVFFDLREQAFVFPPKEVRQLTIERAVRNPLLPLAILFDDTAYDKWREEQKLTKEHANRARSLRSAFSDYLIPVVPLATEDIGTVTLTFKRINSGGTPMNEVHMLRALAWTEKFDLSDHISVARERLKPLGWGKTEDDTLLKILAVVTKQDPTQLDLEPLAKAIGADPSVVDRVGKLVAEAATVLGQELGISTPKALPYQWVLVFVARALHQAGATGLTQQKLRALSGWVATVCLDERFGGAPDHMIRAEWRAFANRVGLPDVDPPRRRDDKPATAKECWSFGLAWARSKGTALVLAAQQPRLADGYQIEVPESLVYTGSDDVGMLVARSGSGLPVGLDLPKRLDAALRSPANRVVCPAEKLPELRERLFAGDCPREIYESHLLDAEAHALLVRRDLENFFEKRRELIRLAEEQWVRDHGGEVQVVREDRLYSQG